MGVACVTGWQTDAETHGKGKRPPNLLPSARFSRLQKLSAWSCSRCRTDGADDPKSTIYRRPFVDLFTAPKYSDNTKHFDTQFDFIDP